MLGEMTLTREQIETIGNGDYEQGLAVLKTWHRSMQEKYPHTFPGPHNPKTPDQQRIAELERALAGVLRDVDHMVESGVIETDIRIDIIYTRAKKALPNYETIR